MEQYKVLTNRGMQLVYKKVRYILGTNCNIFSNETAMSVTYAFSEPELLQNYTETMDGSYVSPMIAKRFISRRNKCKKLLMNKDVALIVEVTAKGYKYMQDIDIIDDVIFDKTRELIELIADKEIYIAKQRNPNITIEVNELVADLDIDKLKSDLLSILNRNYIKMKTNNIMHK